MSSFSGYDESKHARSSDGKFAAKSTSESEVSLTPEQEYEAHLADGGEDFMNPAYHEEDESPLITDQPEPTDIMDDPSESVAEMEGREGSPYGAVSCARCGASKHIPRNQTLCETCADEVFGGKVVDRHYWEGAGSSISNEPDYEEMALQRSGYYDGPPSNWEPGDVDDLFPQSRYL